MPDVITIAVKGMTLAMASSVGFMQQKEHLKAGASLTGN